MTDTSDSGTRPPQTGTAPAGSDTIACTGCGAPLVVRDWHRILRYDLDPQGRCRHCATPLAGRFGAAAGGFGARRIPVRMAAR